MKTLVKYWGIVTAFGMFVVLVMGATVTNTGSEQGCGKQWPLCHGKLIPEMAVKTAIEFSHRAVVGFETLLILTLAAAALYLYGRHREIRIFATIMVVFLFAQAGLGAWAVMYPQEPTILALHFGVSLISFASVTLTAVYLFEVDREVQFRDRPIHAGLRWMSWAVALFSYIVVYLGALVRHNGASLACKDWPMCNGSLTPHFTPAVASVQAHRAAAAILLVGVALQCAWMWNIKHYRPDLATAATISLALVMLQAVSGALVVWTHLDLFSTLTHAGLVGLMFGGLSYLCVHVLPRSAVAERTVGISSSVHGEAETVGAGH